MHIMNHTVTQSPKNVLYVEKKKLHCTPFSRLIELSTHLIKEVLRFSKSEAFFKIVVKNQIYLPLTGNQSFSVNKLRAMK